MLHLTSWKKAETKNTMMFAQNLDIPALIIGLYKCLKNETHKHGKKHWKIKSENNKG